MPPEVGCIGREGGISSCDVFPAGNSVDIISSSSWKFTACALLTGFLTAALYSIESLRRPNIS